MSESGIWPNDPTSYGLDTTWTVVGNHGPLQLAVQFTYILQREQASKQASKSLATICGFGHATLSSFYK